MAFLDDLFDPENIWNSFTGQQQVPVSNIIGTNDAFGQAFGALNSTVAPGILGFTSALAGVPGATSIPGIGLGVNNQISPYINQNVNLAQQGFFDRANRGGDFSPQMRAEINRQLLQTRSGLGASEAGLGNIIYRGALERDAAERQAFSDAAAAGSQGFGLGRQLYNPDLYAQLGLNQANAMVGDIRNVQANRDNLTNLENNIVAENRNEIYSKGAQILGMIGGGFIGSAMGNPVGGVQAGGAFGSNLFTGGGVQGYGQNAIGGPQYGIGNPGNLFTSILNFGFGGGGGQFVPGAGGRPNAVTAGALPFGGAFV